MDKRSKIGDVVRHPAELANTSVEVEIAIADIMYEARTLRPEVPTFVRIGETNDYVVAIPSSWQNRTVEELQDYMNRTYPNGIPNDT